MKPPIIYNLFPRLAGTMEKWPAHAERAASMGFNWIFLNPVVQPGFSGSLYSVKQYDRVCSDFIPLGGSEDGMRELAETLSEFRRMGLRPIMDLVINHTAIDSPLIKEHPAWFKRDERGEIVHPSATDPADTRKVTVWGDLAEIDNDGSSDREALWQYWRKLVKDSIELGFCGFRCDAAYMVPAALWQQLISEAKCIDGRVLFFAETLGCLEEQMWALKSAGFDYLFNSSKYWNFDQPWALEQHKQYGAIAPSISFPESHDTPRLMHDSGGNTAVQRMRYFLAALFSEGLMMPIGYEFGFTRQMHVVNSRPEDWETTETDLRGFISTVNELKGELKAFATEGQLLSCTPYERPTLVLEKRGNGEQVFILINKDWNAPQSLDLSSLALPAGAKLLRIGKNGERKEAPVELNVTLNAAEIALIH